MKAYLKPDISCVGYMKSEVHPMVSLEIHLVTFALTPENTNAKTIPVGKPSTSGQDEKRRLSLYDGSQSYIHRDLHE